MSPCCAFWDTPPRTRICSRYRRSNDGELTRNTEARYRIRFDQASSFAADGHLRKSRRTIGSMFAKEGFQIIGFLGKSNVLMRGRIRAGSWRASSRVSSVASMPGRGRSAQNHPPWTGRGEWPRARRAQHWGRSDCQPCQVSTSTRCAHYPDHGLWHHLPTRRIRIALSKVTTLTQHDEARGWRIPVTAHPVGIHSADGGGR